MVAEVPVVRALTEEDVKEAWAKVGQAKLRADVAEARAAEAKESVRASRAWLKSSRSWRESSENDLRMAQADVKAAEADAKVAELGVRHRGLKALVVDEASRSLIWRGLSALAVQSPAQFAFLMRLARTPGVEVPSNELGGKRAKSNRHRLVNALVAHGAKKVEVEKAIEHTAAGYDRASRCSQDLAFAGSGLLDGGRLVCPFRAGVHLPAGKRELLRLAGWEVRGRGLVVR
jgi:hypothetical protein